MGASSDRKITIDYDRQLQADGFDHFVRLRFEHSRGGESPSHKWVDVHSTFSGGVATNVDAPPTAADRAAVRLLCATAKTYEASPATCIEKLGAVITAAWGADVCDAWGNLLGEGVTEETKADVIAGWIAYLIALGAFMGGV